MQIERQIKDQFRNMQLPLLREWLDQINPVSKVDQNGMGYSNSGVVYPVNPFSSKIHKDITTLIDQAL